MPQINKPALVDLLCERLAVETGGVDIYHAALEKLVDPTLTARLRHFMEEEAQHRDLLAGYLDRLGVGDRDTPSARLARREGKAYLGLVAEAETPLQLLDILLTVEMTDEGAWELLIDLGRDLHDDELVRTFSSALKQEKEHLRGVRGMVAQRARELMMSADSVMPIQ
jgi:rubrerythrin